MTTVLVTGGCGFIGSAFLRIAVRENPDWRFVTLDKLTYAGNVANLAPIAGAPNHTFVRGDICDEALVQGLFEAHAPTHVVHFAAESHVDRSIVGPRRFFEANVMGTLTLLEAARANWRDFDGKVFLHVSTDEVFGELGDTGKFREDTPYSPNSPYSASKAGSDHIVRAYHHTYGMPIKVTNCSNNYGPYQFPEKLIPLMIQNALEGKPLPVYGRGENVRDWLFVDDHCRAILAVLERGRVGETYLVGGDCERNNLDVVRQICARVAAVRGVDPASVEALITFVKDRPGHDHRYAIDASRIQRELGWRPAETFETGLERTVQWYVDNREWVDQVRTGEYRKWLDTNYGGRSS